MKLNDVLQWAGTVCFLVMYTLMSFFKELHVWQIAAGCIGGCLYLAWSVRVANKPQVITNVVGIAICLVGLYKTIG